MDHERTLRDLLQRTALRRAWAPWALAVTLVLAACSSDSDGDAPATGSSPATGAVTSTAVTTSLASTTALATTTSIATTTSLATTTSVAATTSTAPTTTIPTSTTPATIRIVSQNILHGLFCEPDTAQCQLSERVALFMRQLQEAGCPEIVTIQEANAGVVALVEPLLDACGYGLVWDGDPGMDRELVLTVLTPVDSRRIPLAGGVRSAYIVRLDSALGTVDLVSTHLASVRDNRACDPATCPPPCDAADELRACQVRQLLQAAGELATSDIVAVAGDFNATPGEPAYELVVDAGFVDSHLAAGREECSGQTPSSCTVGRDDSSMTDLTDPASRQDARIDYVFIAPLPSRCAIGDATGPFNAEPAQGPIAYPSDHTGVMSAVTCAPTQGGSATTFPPATV